MQNFSFWAIPDQDAEMYFIKIYHCAYNILRYKRICVIVSLCYCDLNLIWCKFENTRKTFTPILTFQKYWQMKNLRFHVQWCILSSNKINKNKTKDKITKCCQNM